LVFHSDKFKLNNFQINEQSRIRGKPFCLMSKSISPLCANEQGFSLHAALRCHANERLKLERLCRYITRPALANDRVKINAKGKVELY
jgi:hypothetical protein